LVTQRGVFFAHGETGTNALTLDVINGVAEEIKATAGIQSQEAFVGLQ